MKLIYSGKTKDIFEGEGGNIVLKFKDDVTGENGVFDPGANSIGLQIEGVGRSNLHMSVMFFEELKKAGVRTHYVSSNLDDATMTVLPCKVFGKGLETICRYRAVGSFIRRYGAYMEPGTPLDAYVEVTLKDDDRGDPLVTPDGLEALGIMSKAQYEDMRALTQRIAGVVRDILAAKGLTLYDIKVEFGMYGDEVILIDEISSGNMRAYRGDEMVPPLMLEQILFV